MAGWIIAAGILLVVALLIEERVGLLHVGEPAPDFTATLSDGTRFTLSAYHGKNPVVLYFYPADFTMGCTQQACAFRDNYDELHAAGAVVVGVSRDTDSSHARFSSEYRLPFPLVSDSGRRIGRMYGIERLGGLIPLPRRVTFVIDKQGIVRAVIHHEVSMQSHVDDVRKELKEIAGRTQD